MVNVSGPGGFRLDFPIPRLPRWIGTPNLRAGNSVYPRVDLDIPISPAPFSIATGALAGSVSVDTSIVRNWASRFGSLFKEFAIVGARLELRLTAVSGGQSGLLLAYIDENSSAAPTAAALDYAHAEVPFTATTVDSTGSMHIVEWKAKSYEDLTWDSTSTAGAVCYLKLFCSNADTGTTNTLTATGMITGSIAVCFRGYI